MFISTQYSKTEKTNSYLLFYLRYEGLQAGLITDKVKFYTDGLADFICNVLFLENIFLICISVASTPKVNTPTACNLVNHGLFSRLWMLLFKTCYVYFNQP